MFVCHQRTTRVHTPTCYSHGLTTPTAYPPVDGRRAAATTALDARASPEKMMHMMASISDVSCGDCGGRGVKDGGGAHGGVESGGGKRGGVESVGGGKDGVALPEKMMQS